MVFIRAVGNTETAKYPHKGTGGVIEIHPTTCFVDLEKGYGHVPYVGRCPVWDSLGAWSG